MPKHRFTAPLELELGSPDGAATTIYDPKAEWESEYDCDGQYIVILHSMVIGDRRLFYYLGGQPAKLHEILGAKGRAEVNRRADDLAAEIAEKERMAAE